MRVADLPSPPPFDRLLAEAPVALFLDFDGTLVELAATPADITVPARLGHALARLAHRLDGRLALVSGRAIEDLEAHCGPLEIDCAGSHGAERRGADGGVLGRAPEALPQGLLDEIDRFARIKGVRYEHKPHGAALHSRAAPELERDCALFMRGLADEHGLVLKHGKRVAELVRPGADKGQAVRAFMDDSPFAGSVPVFIGDDVTDEDGFAACAALGGFAVAAGPRPSGTAAFHLADPAAVRDWLGL